MTQENILILCLFNAQLSTKLAIYIEFLPIFTPKSRRITMKVSPNESLLSYHTFTRRHQIKFSLLFGVVEPLITFFRLLESTRFMVGCKCVKIHDAKQSRRELLLQLHPMLNSTNKIADVWHSRRLYSREYSALHMKGEQVTQILILPKFPKSP